MTPLVGHTVVDVDGGVGRDPGARTARSTRVEARTVDLGRGRDGVRAGRRGSPRLGAEVDRPGRLPVEPDLTLPGQPEVFALGDMVDVHAADGGDRRRCPASRRSRSSRAATPRARSARRLDGGPSRPFHYVDKGNLATIGRSKAVADIKGVRLSGFPAWVTWLVVHLFFLIGFQNRLLVVLRWTISFLTHGRGARLIGERARRG